MSKPDPIHCASSTDHGIQPPQESCPEDTGQGWSNYLPVVVLDLLIVVSGFLAFGVPGMNRFAALDVALATVGCLLLIIAHGIWAKRLARLPLSKARQQAGTTSIVRDTWIAARILLMVSIVVAFGMELSGGAWLIWGGALLLYGIIAMVDTVIGGTTLHTPNRS